MTALLSELRKKWGEALTAHSTDREWRAVALSLSAPVRLMAGVRSRDDRITVILEAPLAHAPKHRIRFHAEGISVTDERHSQDERCRLAVTLERLDLRDIYEVLAIDLITVAAACAGVDLALQQTVRRLEAWQVCLRMRRRGLSREEQAGLIGEIFVLERIAAEIGLARAISAWRGPLDGIHDFTDAGIGIEVKATIGVSHKLYVSRLDQLDPAGLVELAIARLRFVEAPEGRTLPELVHHIRARVDAEVPVVAMDLADRLMRAGYLDADAETYAATRILPNGMHGLRVGPGFPSLVRSSMPPAIVDASYVLDERQLAPYHMPEVDLRSLFRRMGGL